MKVNIRNVLMLLSVIGAAGLSGCATISDADVKANSYEDRVVYHVNNTDGQAVAALRNIGNHLEVNPQAKIVVVTHSRGVDFLFDGAKDKKGNPYNIRVEALKAKGVQFDVCKITLRNRKLDKSKFIPEATFVPSGVAELTRLQQREHYAYVRP